MNYHVTMMVKCLLRQAGLLCDDSLAEVDETFESRGGGRD